MDIKGKTNDNLTARWDLKSICNRSELELDERRPNVKPKAAYTLSNEHKRRVCEWIKGLQFPDGYVSNLARYVDMMELRMHGMKSHDCYVFMLKLIPIVFWEMLPEHVWSALTEVSLLFQSICSTTFDVHKLHELENSVAIILCNLEKIFPPAFFNSMEHLIVHLPYEAYVGEPVQYRWMYPFERFLRELKKKVKNKAHVEASIVEAYIIKEISLFMSQVSIFNYPGRASGAPKKRWLTEPERHIIKTYILTNCEVVTPYYEEKADWLVVAKVKAQRVVDESKWTEICAYQLDEVLPVPVLGTDNQTYDLRDPNGLQVMVHNQAAGTSRSQARQTDDDNEDDDEDSFEDDETDDDEYELT
ncbi:UNVERIFIED_CONTAM: hypothetical protein Slati_3003300 [Sesamum latifolium]|uniref:DUF4218 domain-containing protein n=1 Tax=Sesamum latifolium TaxID=2727402 RepID=A0AAW2VGZ6_9LAMI